MSDSESFADLFAKEQMPGGRARQLNVGDEVKGVVAHIGPDAVFVDLDAKQQGWFDRTELTRPDGTLRVNVGDEVEGRVAQREGDQVKLATGFGRDAGREQLEAALTQGVPIEGKITGTNKGGVEVEVAGARGFCPFSQLDVRFVEQPAEWVGQVHRFLVVEIGDRDVVLSRRKLLEREAASARAEVLGKLQVGAAMSGRVTQVRDFGAFVDLGGIEGLVHVSELSHDRVQRPQDVVSVGDAIDVKVLKVEDGEKGPRISLSLKALAADPWDRIHAVAPQGKVLAGRVTRLADFGAFVRLGEGVEGLLHVSELGTRVKHPSEVLAVGDQKLVVVRGVDENRKRVSLALADEGANEGEVARTLKPVQGAVVQAVVDKHERFGVFVQVAGTQGRAGRGLVPTAELGITRGADVRKEMPVGAEITAKVIDATEGRLRLSIRAAVEDAERAVFDSYRDQQKGRGMGTLGDLLAQKLKK